MSHPPRGRNEGERGRRGGRQSAIGQERFGHERTPSRREGGGERRRSLIIERPGPRFSSESFSRFFDGRHGRSRRAVGREKERWRERGACRRDDTQESGMLSLLDKTPPAEKRRERNRALVLSPLHPVQHTQNNRIRHDNSPLRDAQRRERRQSTSARPWPGRGESAQRERRLGKELPSAPTMPCWRPSCRSRSTLRLAARAKLST